jgi:excisionase family DNA binding protein
MGTPADDNRLLIMDEAMSLLRISRSTMYRLIDRGELQGYKIAKRWLFERKDLEDLIARKRTPGRDSDSYR